MVAKLTPELACLTVWSVWAISWFAAALWSSRTEKRPSAGAESFYRVFTVAGFVMLFMVPAGYQGLLKLWSATDMVGWVMVGLTVIGFLFCWWARIHLGKLWSGWITKKEGHRIIDTGPYALVRHPIYTGILFSAIALVVVKGTLFAVAGAIILIIGYWIKARLEERFLGQELGAEAYDDYARRVPMLIPIL
jgi:protein-S-isoprenylcysteine O-methyltransferase Ste14